MSLGRRPRRMNTVLEGLRQFEGDLPVADEGYGYGPYPENIEMDFPTQMDATPSLEVRPASVSTPPYIPPNDGNAVDLLAKFLQRSGMPGTMTPSTMQPRSAQRTNWTPFIVAGALFFLLTK